MEEKKEKKNRIPRALAACSVALALALSLAGCAQPIDPTRDTSSAAGEATEEEAAPVSAQLVRIADGDVEASTISGAGDEDGPMEIEDVDRQSIFDLYRLPALERMESEDADALVNGLQSIKRVDTIGFDTERLSYPEYWLKCTYNQAYEASDVSYSETTEFHGSTASALNDALAANEGGVVSVRSGEISADEAIEIPSHTSLVGNGATVSPAGADTAVRIQGTEGSSVSDLDIKEGFDYGVYIRDASGFSASGCSVVGATDRAVCVLGDCSGFRLSDNEISGNAHGGIFCCGDVSLGIVEGNHVHGNEGFRNSTPGLFLGNFELTDSDSAKTRFLEPDLDTVDGGPHDIVVIGNTFSYNQAQGVYVHQGWSISIADNLIENNQKEGTCLDYGTIGCYVRGNSYIGNGYREGLDDGEPESSKLPGISLDNACYNVLRGNVFSGQGGSGVKAVRASCRNVILENTITGNNRGVSESGHFYGVELASDMNPDREDSKGMDFAPCFENIVARNTVSGAHYASIYIGGDGYANDVFNNVLMGASDWSIEVHSEKYNSIVDNVVDVAEFYNGTVIPEPADEEGEGNDDGGEAGGE